MKKQVLGIALLSVLTAVSLPASAQLGGVLNRARNRAQQAAQQTVEDARNTAEDATVGAANRAANRVQQQAQQTVDNAVDATVGQAQRTARGTLNRVNNAVNNAVDGAVDATVGAAGRAVDGAVNRVSGAVNSAVDGVVDATVGEASRTVQSATSRATNRIQNMVNGVVDGTVGAAGRAVDGAVQRVTQPVIGTADGIVQSATGSVTTAVEGVYQSVMAPAQQGRNDKQAASYGAVPPVGKKYKPGKKAVQADAQMSNTAVEEGYTRSVQDIHCTYERLDAKLYPYQPYYEYPDYYVMHTRANSALLDRDFQQLMSYSFEVAGTGSSMQVLSVRRVSVPKQREGHVFADETLRNAYTALFVSDPVSIEAFALFVRTLLLDDQRACPLVFPMDDPSRGIISEPDGYQLAFNSYDAYLTMRNNRRDQALCIARSTTPINLVRNAIERWLDAIPEAVDAQERYTLYWLANEAYEEVLINHDKYVAGDDANLALGAKLNEARAFYEDIVAEGQLERMESKSMPATYTVAGLNTQKMVAAATADLGDDWEIVGVEPLAAKWTTAGQKRTLPIATVVQVGKFRFLFPRTLSEAKKGHGWSGTYTVSGDEVPYKLAE